MQDLDTIITRKPVNELILSPPFPHLAILLGKSRYLFRPHAVSKEDYGDRFAGRVLKIWALRIFFGNHSECDGNCGFAGRLGYYTSESLLGNAD